MLWSKKFYDLKNIIWYHKKIYILDFKKWKNTKKISDWNLKKENEKNAKWKKNLKLMY